MGFLVGSSCFLHSPLCQSRFLSSSSSSSSQPMFLYSCTRNAETKKKNIAPMASMHHEDPNHSVHLKRRAILFVGITVLPLLQLKARALEGLATSKTKYQNSLAFKDLHILPLHSFFMALCNKFYFCNKFITLVIWVFKIFAFLMCSL